MSDSGDSRLVRMQKYLALRIDHDYLSKPHWARRWMRVLSFMLPLAGVAALAVLTFNPFTSSGKIVYEPGPVSNQHSWFNHRCEDCHENASGKFGLVSNAKCRVCHDGPLHNTKQLCPNGEKLFKRELVSAKADSKEMIETKVAHEEPRCAGCHTEHKGSQNLVQMNDNNCTQCHANLKLRDHAAPAVEARIVSFSEGHPEWRVLKPEPGRDSGNDPTPIRFNHKKHQSLLYDPSSKFGARSMQCSDCHKPTEGNLEVLCDDSSRLRAFEALLTAPELNAFYDGIAPHARAVDVGKFTLNRMDIRKLAAEALSGSALSERLEKLRDPGGWKALLFAAILNAIRDRIGSGPATVLDSMNSDSADMKRFEALAGPAELAAFFDGVAAGTFQNGVVKIKLERNDIRKLAVHAFENREFSDRIMQIADKEPFKEMCQQAILNLVRERLGNIPGRGQNRYMIPITYERSCASECHWHKLPPVKLSDNSIVTPPHGKASEARRVLRNAIYADAVRQALNPPVLSADEKATKVLVKRLRQELEKKSDANALAGKDKKAKDAVLVETLNRTAAEPYQFIADLFNAEEAIQLMGGLFDQNTAKRYAKLKEDKKSTLNENILNKLGSLISAYVDDAPLNAASVDALTEEKLAEAASKLFADRDGVRTRNEKGACLFCHEPTAKKSSRPDNSEVVADVHIPARWLNQSVFNHETHRVIDCESCHANARNSEKTSDVLLPGIQKCQECHKKTGARTDCIECHVYHDKTHQARDRFVSIDDLMKVGAGGVKVREKDCGAKLPEGEPPAPGEDKPPPDGTAPPAPPTPGK